MTKRELIRTHSILNGENLILVWQGSDFENSFETLDYVWKYLFNQIWVSAKEEELGYDALEDNNLLKYIDKEKVVNDMLKEDYRVIDISKIGMDEEVKFD